HPTSLGEVRAVAQRERPVRQLDGGSGEHAGHLRLRSARGVALVYAGVLARLDDTEREVLAPTREHGVKPRELKRRELDTADRHREVVMPRAWMEARDAEASK